MEMYEVIAVIDEYLNDYCTKEKQAERKLRIDSSSFERYFNSALKYSAVIDTLTELKQELITKDVKSKLNCSTSCTAINDTTHDYRIVEHTMANVYNKKTGKYDYQEVGSYIVTVLYDITATRAQEVYTELMRTVDQQDTQYSLERLD